MIRKNIDIIAIALLLGGVAFYSAARNCVRIEANRFGGIRITNSQSYYRPIIVPPLPYARD